MNFVIPMAGKGTRFITAGYSTPKALLGAHGKTLLEWSIDSLPLGLSTRLVFVGLKKQSRDLERIINKKYEEYSPLFVWLENTTRGQSETVLKATPYCDESRSLLIYNIDTAFKSATLAVALVSSASDGVLGAFRSNESRFSFAALNDDGFVARVAEKAPISDYALTGLYHFQSTKDFIRVAEDAIKHAKVVKGEYFVAPLYDELINEGKRFTIDLCDQVDILGTPDEYEAFLQTKRFVGLQ
jgi:dTDP-glucose pyrophosphorylase